MKNTLILLIIAMLTMAATNANATSYTLNANQIWFDTGIDLNNSSVTFSNAETHSNNRNHPKQWTWGIRYYFQTQGIPYVWTDADGSYGNWDPVLDGMINDEWYRGPGASHGQLIGYIGSENPFHHENDLNFRNYVFGIGSQTISFAGTGSLWIGINDAFADISDNLQDNSGWLTVDIAQPVPEPGTVMLLGLGLLGLAGLRKRIRQ